MTERTFHIVKKIKATDEQWAKIDALVKSIEENDINEEVLFVLIDTADVEEGVLSDVFVPVVVTKSRVSFELEEVVVFPGTIDWITNHTPVVYGTVTVWRREEF